MITLDNADPTPPSEQIRAQIATLIRAGELPADHQLPSVRQLAADLRAAPGTIARSYRSLEAAGLVESSRSRGTRVRPGNAASEQVNRAAAALVDALADDAVPLDDVLAAVRTSWLRRNPDRPQTNGAQPTSRTEQKGQTG